MTMVQTAAKVEVLAAPVDTIDTELLILPVFETEPLPESHPLVAATGREVLRAVASGEFKGKLFDLFFSPISDSRWKASRVLLAGLGRRADYSVDRLRRLATAAALAARQHHHERVALIWSDGANLAHTTQAIGEGLVLADFDAAQYKTGDDHTPRLRALVVVLDPGATPDARKAATEGAERGRIFGESCNVTRWLANEPGNTLTPRVFADRASAIATEVKLGVEVLDERQIAELGMGLLLGVARGSSEPPRLIVLQHNPPGAPAGPVLGLVGKGITFDSGGISIKPADGMERMKDDMAGGAAVLGAMRAMAMLGAPIRVVGVVPTTENMPGGRAVKPGDILRGACGKTVEVINTDAEGRLVLGDGLWYAQRLGATHLVDVATLTGACVVALGKITSGLFGTPKRWVDVVSEAADRAGDRVWPMPMFEEYREQLRSDIADFSNTGGRPAGAITAALFLKEFAGSLPWAHLDIAGTAWAEEAKPFLPRGASGVAVRTLAELAWTSPTWGV
ncbi:MAG TPA: leucyl aminopeptidase [Vicinamibacterales bacterium]|jgi:leucyl aminopeptidase